MIRAAIHFVEDRKLRQVLDCASPLALWVGRGAKSARGLAQSKTLTRRIGRLAVFAGWLFLSAGRPLSAQTNSEPTNDLPKLLPPYGELPPTFWEQHGAAMVLVSLVVLILIALIVWWRLRPKPPVILPPEVQARTALEALRQRPEDGACLSHISQILRRYFLAAFQLPPGELTTAEFCQMLSGHAQIGGELSTAVAAFLHRCDEQKFSPGKSSVALGAVEQALALIAQAEARRALAKKPDASRA